MDYVFFRYTHSTNLKCNDQGEIRIFENTSLELCKNYAKLSEEGKYIFYYAVKGSCHLCEKIQEDIIAAPYSYDEDDAGAETYILANYLFESEYSEYESDRKSIMDDRPQIYNKQACNEIFNFCGKFHSFTKSSLGKAVVRRG